MIDYETFIRHSERVCKNSEAVNSARPMLQGILLKENGDAFVTDSHRLYWAKEIHDHRDSVVISPKGKVIKGEYPDVSRLIPTSTDAKYEVNLDVNEALKGVDIIRHIGVLDNPKPLVLFESNALTYAGVQVEIRYRLDVLFEEPMYFNPQYLLETIKLFKAAKCERVKIRFYGRMRPITLTNEDESLFALILPVRKY